MMKERVVYFLGAGFSAPLGLPVMSNFIQISKNIYYSDKEKYQKYSDIFKTIKEIAYITNFFKTDLENIEEILSILEMQDFLDSKSQTLKFKEYISSVIKSSTPENELLDKDSFSYWADWLFGNDKWRQYGYFISNILNLILYFEYNRANINIIRNCKTEYSIITMNYDSIVELLIEFLRKKHILIDKEFKLSYSFEEKNTYNNAFCIAKLHGTADNPESIITPTWSKGSNRELILPSWKLAENLLIEANSVRILGYSLSEADSYVRYLLKSAMVNEQNLRDIDVICLDHEGDVKKRYDNFIISKHYNFKNDKIENYLELISLLQKMDFQDEQDKQNHSFNAIERAHKLFMETTNTPKLLDTCRQAAR